MSFRTMAVVTAAVTLVLGVGYLVAGPLMVGRWQIEPTTGVLLFGRRTGALYLALAVMFFLARSTPASAARTALSAGAAVATSGLALLGIYERTVGHAGGGILVSVAIEALLALGYLRILVTDRAPAAPAG